MSRHQACVKRSEDLTPYGASPVSRLACLGASLAGRPPAGREKALRPGQRRPILGIGGGLPRDSHDGGRGSLERCARKCAERAFPAVFRDPATRGFSLDQLLTAASDVLLTLDSFRLSSISRRRRAASPSWMLALDVGSPPWRAATCLCSFRIC